MSVNGIAMNVDRIDGEGDVATIEAVALVDREGSNALDLRIDDGNLMIDLDDLATVLRFYGFEVTAPAGEGR